MIARTASRAASEPANISTCIPVDDTWARTVTGPSASGATVTVTVWVPRPAEASENRGRASCWPSGAGVCGAAAVGAGAVVTRDVAPFAVVVGNPARIVRRRFSEGVIAALLRLAWWDWPHERLRAAMADFRGLDAEAFCAKHDPG